MHDAHDQIPSPDGGTAFTGVPGDSRSLASHEQLIEAIRTEVDRLSELDPAEVVEPAADVAEMLSRLLEEVER